MRKNLLISVVILIVILIILTPIFVVGSGINCFLQSRKQIIIVALKNEADIEASKNLISKIPHVKKITVIYKDKEWEKMLKEMGNIPNIKGSLRNKIFIKADNQKNIEKIKHHLKEKDFIEDISYGSDTECAEKILKGVFKKDF